MEQSVTVKSSSCELCHPSQFTARSLCVAPLILERMAIRTDVIISSQAYLSLNVQITAQMNRDTCVLMRVLEFTAQGS